jgi:hypothetical protein
MVEKWWNIAKFVFALSTSSLCVFKLFLEELLLAGRGLDTAEIQPKERYKRRGREKLLSIASQWHRP